MWYVRYINTHSFIHNFMCDVRSLKGKTLFRMWLLASLLFLRRHDSQAPFTRVQTNFCTDKNLHGSTLRLHGTSGTGRIFERLSVQVRDWLKTCKRGLRPRGPGIDVWFYTMQWSKICTSRGFEFSFLLLVASLACCFSTGDLSRSRELW